MPRVYRSQDDLDRAVEAATKRSYVAGIDLGSARDYSAISVLELVEAPCVELNAPVPKVPDYSVHYNLRYVERLPLGQDYVAIVDQFAAIVNTPPIRGCTVACDYSGVGRPVFTMLEEAGLRPVGVQITGGAAWSKEGNIFNVSKAYLMSNLLKSIHKRSLRIPPDLPDIEILRAELQDLRTTTSAAGYVKIGAETGRHDDMALSLAVAMFVAVHRARPAVVGRFLI
jgi:hypothetical protein